MTKIEDGIIDINGFELSKKMTLKDFVNSSFYHQQNLDMEIFLNSEYEINGHNFIISLFFKENKLSILTLCCVDKDLKIDEEHEYERKQIHDDILKEWNIKNEYSWGAIESIYDNIGNTSGIIFSFA